MVVATGTQVSGASPSISKRWEIGPNRLYLGVLIDNFVRCAHSYKSFFPILGQTQELRNTVRRLGRETVLPNL